MLASKNLACLILATLATASPTPKSAASLDKRASINDCGDWSFENHSSDASPLVTDCQQIATNIAGGGTWTVGAGGEHHQLLQYGTCAFGAQGERDMNAAYIGNQDIIDVINESMKRFQWNGKVGASGVMGCQSLQGLVSGTKMVWGIYHN